MHELAITEGILEAAVPEAVRQGAEKVLEIRLKIGELSGVVPECVYEYFEMISKGTIAEGARIVVEYIPISISCGDCGYEGVMDRKKRVCPECGGRSIRITGGREYYVDSLLVE
ncbi:MAG: hydrogenase maturation nickel metallochaperone HypA [Firmicutes bacterium]|nr:hydrogenase maturation nickel metallochaperone HypA [Bacillota bacterium]